MGSIEAKCDASYVKQTIVSQFEENQEALPEEKASLSKIKGTDK